MVSEKEILAAFDLYLSEEKLELYDINISNYPAISRVEVFIVSDYEIDVDLTSRLNKQLQRLLDNMGIEKGSYEMIVSSPGIERKLKTKRHFELSVNERVKIKLIEPILEQHQHSVTEHYLIEGFINSVGNNHITLSKIFPPFLLDNSKIEISNVKNAKIEFKKFKKRVKG